MRKLLINKNDANQRVDKFLSKALVNLPKNLMYKYIRNKKIKVNGKRCEISQRLNIGDEVTCYIAEEFFADSKDASFLKATQNLDILYEDENIMIMNKEVGLLVHSDSNENIDTLINRMKYYLYQKGEYNFEEESSFAPSLCHRLDRNTQGLIIGAKNAQSLRDMNESIHDQQVEKRYLCMVEGLFKEKEKKLIAYHKKEDQTVFISDKEQKGYKKIITSYRVIKELDGLSLLEINLHTGKSHQIRALMAHLKHPIYGDRKYGAPKRLYPYQALCAYQIHFKRMVGCLSYLNDQTVTLKKIDFLNQFD